MSDIVYLPEITRKRKIWDRYEPSSFRVLGDEAMNLAPFFPYNDFRGPLRPARQPANDLEMPHNVKYTSVLPQGITDFRANNPHPARAKVIDGNVMSLLEPICDVTTNDVVRERERWWPPAPPNMDKPKPPITINTTYRNSYQKSAEKAPKQTRHSANPNTIAAKGPLPVSGVPLQGDDPKLFFERKSFEMMYDARRDPNYPIRGKRAGAFVWEPVSPQRARNFMEYRAWLESQKPASQRPRPNPTQHEAAYYPIIDKHDKIRDKIPKGYVVYPANQPAKPPTPVYMHGPPEPLTESLVNADIDTFSKPEKPIPERVPEPAVQKMEEQATSTACTCASD